MVISEFDLTRLIFQGAPRRPQWRTTLTLVSKVTGNAGQDPTLPKRFHATACRTDSLSDRRLSPGLAVLVRGSRDVEVETTSVWAKRKATLFTRLWTVSSLGRRWYFVNNGGKKLRKANDSYIWQVFDEDAFSNVVSFTVKPINGNYGPWSTWTKCSKSCGGGVRSRVRNCTNPAPAFGGMDCSAQGEPQESEPCKTRQICPGQQFSFHQSSVSLMFYSVDISHSGPLFDSNYLGKGK